MPDADPQPTPEAAPAAPDPKAILSSPKFLAADESVKHEVLMRVSPKYAGAGEDVQREVRKHYVADSVAHAAESVGIDPHFAVAIAHQETGGKYNEDATSPKGARGVMQVMPDTFDATKAEIASGKLPQPQGAPEPIGVGVAYLRKLQDLYKGIPDDQRQQFIAAGYNAGPGNVAKAQAAAQAAGLDPTKYASIERFLPGETRAYVPKVGTYLGALYAGKEQAPGGEPTVGAPSPAPGETIHPTPSPGEQAANALDIAKRAGQAALFDLYAFPAHEADRFGYSLGFPGFSPPADHVKQLEDSPIGKLLGKEDIDTLSLETPTGFWSRVGAAAGVLEPVYAPAWGTYVAVRSFGGDEAMARGWETVVSGVGFIHEATKFVANRRALKRIAEVVDKQKATVIGPAEERAATEVPEAHAEVLRLQTELDAKRAGITQAVEEQKRLHAAAMAQGEAAKVAIVQHTAGGPRDLVELGERLQRAGKKGILGGGAARLRKLTGAAYDAWKEAGTAAKIEAPASSAQRAALADTANEIGQLARIEGATPAERAIAQEVADVLTPTLPTGSRAAVQRALEEGRIGKHVSQQTPSIPIAQLIDLKSSIGKVALSPQDYPVMRSRAGRILFGKLGGQLDDLLSSLSVGHPEVEAASRAAKKLATEQFAFRKTAKLLGRAETPEQAAASLFSDTRPTRLLRILREATPAEIEALQKGALSDIYKTGADASGTPDFAAARDAWQKVSWRTRRILAAIGHPEGQQELFTQLHSRRINLDAKALMEAEARQTALLRDLAAAQQAAEGTVVDKVLGKMNVEERAQAAALAKAQTRLAKAERIVPDATAKAAAKVIEFRRTGGQQPGGFGRMMGKRAAIMLGVNVMTGGAMTPATVVGNAAWVHLMLVYPLYVRAAIRTPLNTEKGLRMARSIAGILNGYYGLSGSRGPSAPGAPSPGGPAPQGGPGTQGATTGQPGQ